MFYLGLLREEVARLIKRLLVTQHDRAMDLWLDGIATTWGLLLFASLHPRASFT